MTLGAYLGPFIMSFFIALFILVMQFMALYMKEIFGKGVDVVVLGKLFSYAAGRLSLTALPVAILAGSLMAFGSMGEHYELAALKACGIGLFKTIRSVFFFTLLLTLFSVLVSFDIIPTANLKFFSLLYDVQRKKPEVAIKPGYFYSDIDGYVIRIADKNVGTGALYDIMIYDHTENRGNVDVIMADSAFMQMAGNKMQMILFAGNRHQEYKPTKGQPEGIPYGRTYFDSLYYQFELEGFDLNRTDEKQFRHQIVMKRVELLSAIDSLTGVSDNYRDKSLKQLARYNKIDSLFITRGRDSVNLAQPVAVVDLEGKNVLECFDANTNIALASKALVNSRAIKSYLEFMIKKKADHARNDRNYRYEYHFRWALPFNCLLFLLIGASLGAIIRKGGLGPPALISIIFFMLFYILTTYGKKFTKEDVMEPWMGAWLSVLVIAPIAVVVTFQAATDAKIL
ncbi:MAG: LptF/LptG family permease, partial [Bacteroidota bacterium]